MPTYAPNKPDVWARAHFDANEYTAHIHDVQLTVYRSTIDGDWHMVMVPADGILQRTFRTRLYMAESDARAAQREARALLRAEFGF